MRFLRISSFKVLEFITYFAEAESLIVLPPIFVMLRIKNSPAYCEIYLSRFSIIEVITKWVCVKFNLNR